MNNMNLHEFEQNITDKLFTLKQKYPGTPKGDQGLSPRLSRKALTRVLGRAGGKRFVSRGEQLVRFYYCIMNEFWVSRG